MIIIRTSVINKRKGIKMVVQFELGSKHLENKKLAAEAIQALKGKNTKEIVAELMAKSYGSIPSDKALYNYYLGLAVSL